MRYGIEYKGSKSRIAKEIIEILPSGDRFIDLFGGGGAVSHCASLSGKYKEVIYNDLNPSIYSLVKDTFTGKYTKDKFLFEWVSRDLFNKERMENPVIRWCWSFGCDRLYYLYSKEMECIKESVYKAIVNKEYSTVFLELTNNLIPFGDSVDLTVRKSEWSTFCRTMLKTPDKYRVESLERLLSLYSFTLLNNISFTNTTYLDYEYRDGDIVYCDPPYCGKRQDAYKGFDSKQFIEWARKIPCYISEYSMPEDFSTLYSKNVQNNANRVNITNLRAEEKLFVSPYYKGTVCVNVNHTQY